MVLYTLLKLEQSNFRCMSRNPLKVTPIPFLLRASRVGSGKLVRLREAAVSRSQSAPESRGDMNGLGSDPTGVGDPKHCQAY